MSNLKKLIIIAVVISVLLVNTEAASDKTSIKVKSLMLKGEKVPIIVILKDQPLFHALSKENAVPLLKRHATNGQHNIAVLLNEEKKRDKTDKIKQFWIVNAIAVNASPELIEQLSARDDVESIELDSQVHMIEDYSVQVSRGQIDTATTEIKRINATRVWDIGINGAGINVSVIDTGIYATHSDISGRVIKWVDYVSSLGSPYDDNGHGTHVAGTVGGNGAGGTTTGVAPNVSLFGAKVLDSNGNGYSSDIIKAIEWSVENKADIVSLSLGGDRDTAMKNAINNVISAGVTVIAAAGNCGPGAGTIIFPAGEKNVIAVGAINSLDNIAYFSSRGSITVDGEELIKPDIGAPGVCINSLSKNGGYAYCWQGTSMATSHVSGTVALLLQAARKNGILLSPAQVRSILENTSVDLGTTGKDNVYGAGRIDVFEAMREYAISTINGTVLDKTSRTGISDVIVSTNTSISTVTNASGFYSLVVTAGIYNLTAKSDPIYITNNTITVSTIGSIVLKQDIELVGKPTGTITGSVTVI